jgi:hypothetical protein
LFQINHLLPYLRILGEEYLLTELNKIMVLASYASPHLNDFAQTKQSKSDYHVYPSKKKGMKAFTANNFAFFDKDCK